MRPPGEPRPWVQTPASERSASLAPDGRWAAYTSDESGRDEVYVRAFPDPTGRWQVSSGGGSEPLWSRDGRTIYYRRRDSLYAASVSTQPTFEVGGQRGLFLDTYQHNNNHTNYDRNPITGEFLMLGQAMDTDASLVVVINWVDELRSRMRGDR